MCYLFTFFGQINYAVAQKWTAFFIPGSSFIGHPLSIQLIYGFFASIVSRSEGGARASLSLACNPQNGRRDNPTSIPVIYPEWPRV